MIKTKSKRRLRCTTIARTRIINGRPTEVLFHYYRGHRPKLFAVANGSVKTSYSGKVATNVYNRVKDEKMQNDRKAG